MFDFVNKYTNKKTYSKIFSNWTSLKLWSDFFKRNQGVLIPITALTLAGSGLYYVSKTNYYSKLNSEQITRLLRDLSISTETVNFCKENLAETTKELIFNRA